MPMNEHPTLHNFYKTQANALHLKWVAGKGNENRTFVKNLSNSKTGVVGYFNLIHSSQAQILGNTEMQYLQSLKKQALEESLDRLFDQETVLAIIADNRIPFPKMKELANRRQVALFTSDLPGEQLLDELRYYFTQLLANKVNLHGVFMEVLSIGVLLTGDSGVGKSELALELVTRGHRLIADDAPLFARIAPDIIIGTSPPVIQDFLEVRGLGILNIRHMYGDSVIKMSKYLKLIISLQVGKDGVTDNNRLIAPKQTRNVLGMEIPVSIIPVAAGRNLAVLVEAAVRNHLLRLSNYYADTDIISRQQEVMRES